MWASMIRRLLDSSAGADAFPQDDAYRVLAAMLDDGVDELELGAILGIFEARGVTPSQLLGFCRAINERCFRFASPRGGIRPVVFASHVGTRAVPNLLALLALTLPRFGVPVLIHGTLHGDGGVATAHVLRELEVMPCVSAVQVEQQLAENRLAWAPTAALAPGLGELLALKSRLGFSGIAQLLAKLLMPFESGALLAVASGSAQERLIIREALCACRYHALLLDGTEGEAFANPGCRPQMEYICEGTAQVLFEAEANAYRARSTLPGAADAASTARWIRSVLDGDTPLPFPIVNQLACCLYGAGYTDDLVQAKAIVAVETGSLIAA